MKKQILLLIFLGVSLPLQGMGNNDGRQVRDSWGCCITKWVAVCAILNAPSIADFYFNGESPCLPCLSKLENSQQHLGIVWDNENRYTREFPCVDHPEFDTSLHCIAGQVENGDTGEVLGRACYIEGLGLDGPVSTAIVYDETLGVPCDEGKAILACLADALEDEEEYTYLRVVPDFLKPFLIKKKLHVLPDDAVLILPSKKKR